jgi:hypothetical protein
VMGQRELFELHLVAAFHDGFASSGLMQHCQAKCCAPSTLRWKSS